MKNTVKLTALMLSLLMLATLFVSCAEDDTEVGCEVGNRCPSYAVQLLDHQGNKTDNTFDPANNSGMITVINFWGTWCGYCVQEMPHFDRIAKEYEENVTVIAIHSTYYLEAAPKFISESYASSEILFACDSLADADDPYAPDVFYSALGGTGSYPLTVILDENGIIADIIPYATTYEDLKTVIDQELSE